jgi:predicted DCC family thiol-disulfide oxidoreductase YuxK
MSENNALAPMDRLVYDGGCGLCHNAVKLVIQHDPGGERFKFTPLESPIVEASLPEGVGREQLPDSMLVITTRGELLMKSDAALYVASRLKHPLAPLASLVRALVPRVVRDSIYDFIASIRHKLFKKPEEACPLLPAHLRRRFEF